MLFIFRFTQTQNTICGSWDEIEKVFSYLFGTFCDAGGVSIKFIFELARNSSSGSFDGFVKESLGFLVTCFLIKLWMKRVEENWNTKFLKFKDLPVSLENSERFGEQNY